MPQKKNLGFAAAVNLAAKKARTPWLVILNDDLQIKDPKTFSKMLKFAKKHNLSAVSPVLKTPKGEIENMGYRVLPFGKVELVKEIEGNIDGLSATCLLIKRQVFEKAGGFDKRFFAYLEDVDLFLRLKKRGEKFGICPDTEIIHYHMTTSSNMGVFKQKQDFKNWILLISKN